VEHWTQENTGEVVRVFRAGHIDCPECGSHTEVPPSVTVGDHVLFASESGQELRIAGDRLLLLRDTDLLAVFEPEVTT
jgi:co-chaperonin GroES (HSP10)